jgi:hypothetical protein
VNRDIPGRVDGRALAMLFGDQPRAATSHKPSNRHEFAAAARDLIGRGYSTGDVAHALGLTRPAVLDLLAEPSHAA